MEDCQSVSHDGFVLWLAQVDDLVRCRIGLSIKDLADQPYADWFEDGLSPREAELMILEYEGVL